MKSIYSSLFVISFTIWALSSLGKAHPTFSSNSGISSKSRDSVLRFISEQDGGTPTQSTVPSDQGQHRHTTRSPTLVQQTVTLKKAVKNFLGDSHSHPRFHSFWKAISCDICQVAVTVFQDMLARNVSQKEIIKALVDVCSSLDIEKHRVCAGIGSLFSPEIFTVFDKLVLNPNEICGIFFDSCGHPYNPFDHWNVTFPGVPKPPPVGPRPPKRDSPTMRVLHLTDMHIDLEYKVGSVAECGEPLCCREGNGSTNGAWKFGDYRNCDTPPWTLDAMLAHLATQKFDYIIWTGDVPGHNIWNQSRDDQLKVLSYANDMLLKHFPGKRIYPSLGNHESSPVNSFPPSYIKGANSISWLYEALADHWSHFLPKDAISTVRSGAYYTVSPFPGFRIISLNMNYCNDQNWWMLLNETDPNGELQWLIDTLQAAEDKKEKVHILGHIPPGIIDCLPRWSWNFYKIVSRYENTIAGQFYGHTHFDSFCVFYDEETRKRPINVAYVAPSVTPYSDSNMAYRFYIMDGHYAGSSYHVLDHETHYLNLSRANLEGKMTFEKEYSAKATYNLPNLFPSDWDNLIDVMKTNQTLMDLYNKFYTKSRHNETCSASCRSELLCEARSGRSYDPSFCNDL